MGEFVESNLEKLIPVFEQLTNVQLLEMSEVESLVKRCRRYEYRLAKKEKTPQDYILYGEYLCELLTLVRSRRARAEYWHKLQEIDRNIIEKITSLYRCCCDRFQGDLNHWERLFAFLKKHNCHRSLSKAYSRCLQIHGRNVELRCRSALWEFFGNASAENARVQLQLALRIYPQEFKLFCALFKIELGYVNKIIKRREYLKQVSREEKERVDEVNSDVDESIFDAEVDDSILQLKVAQLVIVSALKNVPDHHKSEMLLKMWIDLCSFQKLPCGPASEVKELLETNISELGEEHAQLLLIEKDRQLGMDIFEAYEAAVVRLDTEGMYRRYLQFCVERKNDPLASLKLGNVLNVLVQRGWVNSNDMNSIEEKLDDILSSENDKLAVLETAVQNSPNSVVFWSELIRIHLETCQEGKTSQIVNLLNSAFENVAPENALPLWELAIDYSVAHEPETIEQIFSRAYLAGPPSVSSQVKIIHLEYMNVLCCEEKITNNERRENAITLMRNKPNTTEFYLAVADGELTQNSPDHKLIRQAHEYSVIEAGKDCVDSWVRYGYYCMKHDVCNFAKVYQRAMGSLVPSLCSDFITEWTRLQQKEAVISNEHEMKASVPDGKNMINKKRKRSGPVTDEEVSKPIVDVVESIKCSDIERCDQETSPKPKYASVENTISPKIQAEAAVPVTPTRKRTKRTSTSSDVTRSPARTRHQKALALEHPELFEEE